ncbi:MULTISPECIES: hypothetical protein [Pyrobaculum]|uniref:Uncharacterized protein n=2 Tax=Pyrobaculum arsenaticum TaxID=121277 RepID=A4WM62_PYRAR|nr:hypothetical protein [Pyrobaculum arsenaticum]ABP51479.1 conserved hypothetical protein [Pyrobaculum arsenaticum DSM 13514]MCY0890956.1 hypothetical protein [Pyrobaculum arsenaticum]NYR16552.1 hypothetical protein [Pyrobaculum arsenaticum]
MEKLPEDVLRKIREFSKTLEGAGARAIVNYVLYELEVGGPSREVLAEAEQMARQEVEELKKVLELVEELKSLMA